MNQKKTAPPKPGLDSLTRIPRPRPLAGSGHRSAQAASTDPQAQLIQRQALASLGQSLLIDIYRNEFEKFDLLAAQILVSNTDFKNRRHYKNLKNTIDQLFHWNAIPIINENDAVATEELRLGDNDTLSSSIAGMYPQAFLILLSTVDGFYVNEKRKPIIEEITSREMKHAGEPLSGGIGGMKTKLHAAKKVIRSGQLMNISHGGAPEILETIMKAREVGTWFFQGSVTSSLKSKKRWLLHNPNSSGSLEVDPGAEEAISKSASLLGVGVKKVEGEFSSGEIVLIKNHESSVFAKGIVSLDSGSLKSARNTKGVEVIHRDNLVIL